MPRTIAIIPARYGSTRFPGKLLADETGRPLIQHVYERAVQATSIESVLIATDDRRIAEHAAGFGAPVVMTRSDHPNGTSRLAEAVGTLDAEIIVNVQGDEPEIDPSLIDRAVRALGDQPNCPMSTIASPFTTDDDPADPNAVKLVIDQRGKAMYFSRALIPHTRDADSAAIAPLKHIGLYAYRRAFLLHYVTLPQTPLERSERLEQLRVLEHGHDIAVTVVPSHFCSWGGIDTPEQYAAFVQRHRETIEQ